MSQEQASEEETIRSGIEETEDRSPEPLGSDESSRSRRLAALESENERLREAVSDANRRRYRFTAIGFAIIGLVAIGGAVVFSTDRTVLLALGGTGIFGAVLTYALTPERFIAASVGDRIYGTLAENEAAIVDDLALQGEPTVVPTDDPTDPARLFISLAPETLPSDSADLTVPFVTGESPGISLRPTGVGLYDDLADGAAAFPETPHGIAMTVGDALVEQFELVDGVDVDADTARVTMAIEGSSYGSVERFDHPVASVLATTLAIELDRPITISVTEADRVDWLVTCAFDQDGR